MSKIFIDRPIFAWVIAIIIMLSGIGAITKLPVAQYPDVAPTQINVRATYPGASAETIENSVTQVLARLPQQVQQQGVTVTKGSPDFLMIVGVYDETDRATNFDISDWLTTNL